MRRRVAVIGGGANSEHEVSLATADGVQAALSLSYDVERLDVDRDGRWCERDGTVIDTARAMARLAACDVLFPLVHGPDGEDGTLAGLARMLGLPCVGSGVGAGAVAMDKWVTKLVAQDVGIRVAPGRLLRRGETHPWPGPAVVKPVAGGSSQGVSPAATPADWDRALDEAFRHDDRVLAEVFVSGREIDVAVLRRADGSLLVSPPLEIDVPGFFDYDSKYGGEARFVVPAPLSEPLRDELESLALTMFTALGCSGVARIDFFLTPDGFLLNEVNTVPGMTAQSQVPRMLAHAGIPYAELVAELVRAALAQDRARHRCGTSVRALAGTQP
ncbi:MAG: D-alanine--D-alanine ligase [Nocardioides sp.]|uniref:D-alanine--D-alanine ligase family protein n=1 Tax=Nocardioides sp. TaxID=35761 RepID=UPI003F00C90A